MSYGSISPYTLSANSLLRSLSSSDTCFRNRGVRIRANIFKSGTKNHKVLALMSGLWPSELLPQDLPGRSHPLLFFLLYLLLCLEQANLPPKHCLPQDCSRKNGVPRMSVSGLSVPVWPSLAPKQPQQPQASCPRHGVFPAEGTSRESGSQLPAPSRQNHIRASPASLSPSREQSAPPQKGGERGLGETEETSTSPAGGRAGKTLASSATTVCGKIDVDPHGISEASKMNSGPSSAAGPGLKGVERQLSGSGGPQLAASSFPLLPFPGVIQLSVCLAPKVTRH